MKEEIRFYLSVFLRRFHYFLVVAGLVSAAGITVATILPAVYRAEAVLLVEGAQIPGNLATSTVQVGVAQQMKIIEQRLLTRAELINVSSELNIYANREGLDPNAIVADLRKRIIIQSRLGRGNNTIIVGFEGADPVKTAEVANALVTRVLEENVRLRTGSASQTLSFFEEEAARLSAAIDRKSAEILEFKLANQNALPDSINYRRAQQAELQERKVQLQRDEVNLNERRAGLVDLFERTGRVAPIEENLTPEQRQLIKLQNDLDNALLIYSDRNPQVRLLQNRIAAIETVVAAQMAEAGTDGEEGPSLFDIQISDIDSQLNNIETERARIDGELVSLQESLDATPTNSIRLSELEREFATIRAQYNSAAGRLAEAAMGERIEVTSKGQRISLLEQAIVPQSPARPSRKLIAAASVGGGFALGLGLVVLLEFLNTSIRRPAEITRKLQITPIATFPLVRTRRQVVWRKTIMFSVLGIAIIGIPLAIWLLHTFYLPLDMLIDRVLGKTGLDSVLKNLQGELGQ